VIGGASYEGVRHAPWQAKKPAATAPQGSVAASARPIDLVLAQRRPSRTSLPATARTHGNAAKAKQKQAVKLKTHGRGRQTRSASAAGVATHVKVAHQPHRAQPTRSAPAHAKVKHQPKQNSKQKAHQQAGPPTANPPAGHGKQK
jgi:hypothetical protein